MLVQAFELGNSIVDALLLISIVEREVQVFADARDIFLEGLTCDLYRRLGGEIEVERSPPTGKSFRFVRACERARRSCVGGREK